MFTSGRSRVACVLVCALVVALALPSVAQAYEGTSPTNPTFPSIVFPDDPNMPLAEGDPDPLALSWWRHAWGSSLRPSFRFEVPTSLEYPEPNEFLGFWYTIDRSVDTTIDPATPERYYQSPRPNGSIVDLTFDILGVYNYPPAGGWGYSVVGQRVPWEGEWYLHIRWYDEAGAVTPTEHVPVRIDLTAPLAPSKIAASPSLNYVGPTGVWFASSRANVTWEDKEYDALAGTAAYKLYLNGTEVKQPIYHLDSLFTNFTIENLPGGKNKIVVKAIDRAGNLSAAATTYFYSDPDTPTITPVSPVAGGLVGLNATFSAKAADAGGIQWVSFAIDGTVIGTDNSSPYSVSKYMGAYSTGTHTLVIRTRDMYGRTVSKTISFKLDKTFPVISNVSDSSDPFYPVLDDGYKDSMTVRFNTTEGGKCTLFIYNSSGDIYAKRYKTVNAGSQSVSWDGVATDGVTRTGTFTYRVGVTDAAGNTTKTGSYSTTIRDYEIVRIAPNAVKVIPR